MAVRLELSGGLDALDSISETDRAAAFEALFAICDGSAFLSYGVFKIGGGPDRFLLAATPELAVRIRIDWARSRYELLGFSRPDVSWPRELDAL